MPDRSCVRRIFPIQVIRGTVVSLPDGDTITVLDDDKNLHKIRLEGLDALESNQAFGDQAQKALTTLVLEKNVRVEGAKGTSTIASLVMYSSQMNGSTAAR